MAEKYHLAYHKRYGLRAPFYESEILMATASIFPPDFIPFPAGL
jgi:hypothetical protein